MVINMKENLRIIKNVVVYRGYVTRTFIFDNKSITS